MHWVAAVSYEAVLAPTPCSGVGISLHPVHGFDSTVASLIAVSHATIVRVFDGDCWPVGANSSGVVVKLLSTTPPSPSPWQHGVGIYLHPVHGFDPTAASLMAAGHANIVRVV